MRNNTSLAAAYRANAAYENQYLLGTSIARYVTSKAHMEIVEKEGADAVSHGATGKGNDQVRFELTYYAFKPDIKIIAPWREWNLKGREQLIAYCREHKIPVEVTHEKPYSMDDNLLHISYESGILEDPWLEPTDDMWRMTVSPEKAPDKPLVIEVDFEAGNPVAVNGKKYGPAGMLAELNRIGGENGVGRLDFVENRFVGMKNRGCYETPGGFIMQVAHKAMESITMDREVMHIRDSLIPRYSEMLYYGFWFSPERELLQTLIDESNKNVSGTVRLKIYKGNVMVTGRKSDLSLYSEDFATMQEEDVYDQAAAEGFIKLQSLRLRIRKLQGLS